MANIDTVFKQSHKKQLVSIVVPVYNCEQCLPVLCERVDNTLRGMDQNYELILVDDRSSGRTWQIILELCCQYPSLKGIQLSRNFGQHKAITAGLSKSLGDYVIVMDCDLQDPPELIPNLIQKIEQGFDLVLARRNSRKDSFFRQWAAKAYFYLIGRLTDEKIDGSYGNFSILSRKVVDNFLKFGEKERHYLFILRWMGFNIGKIEYEQNQRIAGESSYLFKSLIRHALDGLFFQSTVLLKWIAKTGLIFSLVGFTLALYYIGRYFMYGSVQGWTSLIVLILICTGLIVTSLGVIGIYITKIFDQIKKRPLYIIDKITDD